MLQTYEAIYDHGNVRWLDTPPDAEGARLLVTVLSSGAVKPVQDVAAKVLCDNLQALTAHSARDDADLPESVRINHAYMHTALKPLLPALLLLGKKVVKMLRVVLRLVATHTYVHQANLSKPRTPGPKPHKFMTQKYC